MRSSHKVGLAIVLAVVLVGSITFGLNNLWAQHASGRSGEQYAYNQGPIHKYMDGNRPATPKNADRVGVVSATYTQIKPWLSVQDSFWEGVVYTQDKGRLIRLEVWLLRNPLGVSKRVHVGDYVAIVGKARPPGSTFYSERYNQVDVVVLQAGAVHGIPTDN